MATIRFDIISIGTLSRNILWNEPQAVRTPHATTTLVRAGKRNILVDPGLPTAALGARLFERTGLRPEQIDTVFLTNFRPAHRGGLALFTRAKVCLHELEQQAARERLVRLLGELPEEEDDEDRLRLSRELELLDSCLAAPDQLTPGVDLFPLFGYTAGTCGLLLSMPVNTVLIAGDAVATQDHFLAAQVLPDPANLQGAKEALQEVYEIADVIVPGHDNVFQNPRAAGL
jgi:glyoxylase-like metal-dependent hydrolase (beta-lactamase superfamily II)